MLLLVLVVSRQAGLQGSHPLRLQVDPALVPAIRRKLSLLPLIRLQKTPSLANFVAGSYS